MMTMVALVVFAGALALAVAAMWQTVAPQWDRIARLALGHVEQPFQPLGALAQAERRIAVRRWATSAPAPLGRARAAA